jgi:hypothetical protein
MNKIKTKFKSLDEHFSLARAKRCIALYKLFMVGMFKVPQDQVVKAFTIHSDELLEAMGFHGDEIPHMLEGKYKGVRVYIGLDDEATSGEQAGDFKMFLVPVNSEGKDVIPGKNSIKNDESEYVYDLIAPCPNTCDIESELYKAHY